MRRSADRSADTAVRGDSNAHDVTTRMQNGPNRREPPPTQPRNLDGQPHFPGNFGHIPGNGFPGKPPVGFPGKWKPWGFPGNGSRRVSREIPREIWLASREIHRETPKISPRPRPHFPGNSPGDFPAGSSRGISRGIKFRESSFPGKFPGKCNIPLIRGMTIPIDIRRWRMFCFRPPICGRSPKRRIFVSSDAAPDGGKATATIRRARHLKSKKSFVECGRLDAAFPENKGGL